ncbi:acyl-CoA thioesterase [Rhodocaloribacter litoris]|uniref:acyl-CoA thioesterase n=1 Tax=Rhodocaloribacter litoris TaxID=2558931 RepID=UPI00141F8A44|nr:thioesterase family protein [Rhodocaloribacter litoris]QXD15633.1 acyl-CoA thioesterase [Rhodocaloribacter litoris]GIV61581.1 MAG: thioesterase [Rhodothermaceae bacterium]
MLVHRYRHRVRYRECDPMGLVYHTHYLDYFEAARTEALREMGLAYRELEAAGIVMPVVELAVQYRAPARYDDLLEITSRFAGGVPRVRVRIDYEVRRAGEPDLLVTGHVTLCFFDTARQRPVPAPAAVTEVFARALAATGIAP